MSTITDAQARALDRVEPFTAEYDGDACFLLDILADLMHWADARQIDFNQELQNAYVCYLEETGQL